jgi:hypothetical protein
MLIARYLRSLTASRIVEILLQHRVTSGPRGCANQTWIYKDLESRVYAMADVKAIFDWARDNGEVKAVDRILIKVMLVLIKNKITLTAAAIEKMEARMDLPEELFRAIIVAAEAVVGKPVPPHLLM